MWIEPRADSRHRLCVSGRGSSSLSIFDALFLFAEHSLAITDGKHGVDFSRQPLILAICCGLQECKIDLLFSHHL